jgi:hypothetical protein
MIATATVGPTTASAIQALFFEGTPVEPSVEAVVAEIAAVGAVVGEAVEGVVVELIVVETDRYKV